jgi:universal stress protein E
MYNKILLIPASGGAEQPAVQRVLALGTRSSVEVEVFEPVYESLLEGYYGNKEIYEPLRRRLVQERLEHALVLAAELKAGGCHVSADAVWDHPLDRAIARRVVARDIDLVVTQPLAGRAGALSNADWRLLAICPAPVLVVNSDGTTQYRHIAAAVDPLHAHAKPAELDEAILEHAKALQSLSGADLRVLHCFVPLAQLGAGADFDQLPLKDAESAFEQGRRHEVEQLVAKAGLPRSVIELSSGRPEAVLQRMAEHGEADLVIMGALSRGRLKDFLIGSTAERVLHRSTVDVLAVKPPGMSFAA